MIFALRPLPRPTQFEALDAWIRAAHAKKRELYQGKMRKALRACQEVQWDAQLKRWRVDTIEGERLYPMLVGDGDSQNSNRRENGNNGSDTDDSLLDGLLSERPPPYNPHSEEGR